jgi:hypothetical protein
VSLADAGLFLKGIPKCRLGNPSVVHSCHISTTENRFIGAELFSIPCQFRRSRKDTAKRLFRTESVNFDIQVLLIIWLFILRYRLHPVPRQKIIGHASIQEECFVNKVLEFQFGTKAYIKMECRFHRNAATNNVLVT